MKKTYTKQNLDPYGALHAHQATMDSTVLNAQMELIKLNFLMLDARFVKICQEIPRHFIIEMDQRRQCVLIYVLTQTEILKAIPSVSQDSIFLLTILAEHLFCGFLVSL